MVCVFEEECEACWCDAYLMYDLVEDDHDCAPISGKQVVLIRRNAGKKLLLGSRSLKNGFFCVTVEKFCGIRASWGAVFGAWE